MSEGGRKAGDDIGDRFKEYEAVFDHTLPRRIPMVIRVDGRAFHSLPLTKPFDVWFFGAMSQVAQELCREIQGAAFAYFQSDEISIVALDDMNLGTQPWVGKRLNKILSLSAAIATAEFHHSYQGPGQFDARAFVLPNDEEVLNYCIWRQQDATRNSISMAAQHAFSHKSLQGKSGPQMIDMLREAGKPWEDTPPRFKRGAICRKGKAAKFVQNLQKEIQRNVWEIDEAPPIFTQDREYLRTLLNSLRVT